MVDKPSKTVNPATDLEEIRELIKSTNALNRAEKKYWLDLLPSMSDKQLQQLRNILETEQKNLEEIDKKYDKKLEGVAKKYLKRWDSEKAIAARVKRKKTEKAHKQAAESKAEGLLQDY